MTCALSREKREKGKGCERSEHTDNRGNARYVSEFRNAESPENTNFKLVSDAEKFFFALMDI